MNDRFSIEGPAFPVEDLSGPLGARLLSLLAGQAERDLTWLRDECAGRDAPSHDYEFLFHEPSRRPAHPMHLMYQASGCALQFAALALFGPEEGVGGHRPGELRATALGLVRALCATHPVADPPESCTVTWSHFNCLRLDFVAGLAAWLLWDEVDPATQILLGRMLERDADSWCEGPAPAQLYDDTQAESNAWSSSGMALAYCLLKRHPHRDVWGERAEELMISAFATEADVSRERLVDGKPLNQWLTGPNAFDDYTVENHGIIHGDYLASISEMVRTAILYRLAGEAIPEAVLFNAEEVLHRLIFLGLPDGSHLYVQGSDYIARRFDSFYQACNMLPLIHSPAGSAAFLRALDALERMQAKGPGVPTSGWLGSAFQLGVHWGTVENYLMRRLFGPGAAPMPEEDVNGALAGVHVSEPAKYMVHRTATSLSSFSWHTTAKASQIMGMTMPLGRDVLVASTPPNGYLGSVELQGEGAGTDRLIAHHVSRREDGCGVGVEVERCGGKVLQRSAFISLPDGAGVYIEIRDAREDIAVQRACSGNVAIFDDTRGPYQDAPRVYHTARGAVIPDDNAVFPTNWVNVDDRLGLAAVGADGMRLRLATDYMRSPFGDQWRLGLLSFVTAGRTRCAKDGRMSVFALCSFPHQRARETALCALDLEERDGAFALRVGDVTAYANLSGEPATLPAPGGSTTLAPLECGWVESP